MAETKKKSTTKTPATVPAKPSADAVNEGLDKATKVAEQVFGKLKAHFEVKKVDAWQEKWLAVPANRKKYAKLQDAPEVVGEELVAMTNDIIDFVQGEEAGKSHVFKKLKSSFGGFFKHSVGFLQEKTAKEAVKEVEKANPAPKKTVKKVSKPAKK